VPAPAEPAVVEHEPLDPDLRGHVRQLGQVGQVGLEVDRLPRVQHQRTGGMPVARLRALAAVQPAAEPVQAVGAVHEHHLGGGVALPRREAHLPGFEQLPAAEHGPVHAGTLGQPLDEVLVVAAPGHVRGPHLAVAEAETRCADG